MQIHQGESRVGDVLSLNVLKGQAGERMMHLLLTQGIEIEVAAIGQQVVRLIIRAPGEMLIVEELACPPSGGLPQNEDHSAVE
jgi:hypothetical protein